MELYVCTVLYYLVDSQCKITLSKVINAHSEGSNPKTTSNKDNNFIDTISNFPRYILNRNILSCTCSKEKRVEEKPI